MTEYHEPGFFVLRSKGGNEHGLTAFQYAKRQPHKKSRDGCESCKNRHVKCDETKPVCHRCRRNSWECVYKRHPHAAFVQNGLVQLPLEWPFSASLRNAFASCTNKDLTLLDHYRQAMCNDILPYPQWKTKVLNEIFQFATQHEAVLHSILALSAIHHRRVTSNTTKSRLEAEHALRAVQSLQQRLQGDWWSSIDEVITTCVFMNLFTFADTTPPDKTLPLASQPHGKRFEWVGIQLGLRPLLHGLIARQITSANSNSFWLACFEGLGEHVTDIYDDRHGDVDVPRAWVEFFDVNPSSSCLTHPYLRLLRRLHHIMKPLPEQRKQYQRLRDINFLEGITPAFLSRLRDLDPRALILFALWLGLLCDRGVWWSQTRAMRESWAICYHIEQHEPQLMHWLSQPAEACGYLVKNTEDTPNFDAIQTTRYATED